MNISEFTNLHEDQQSYNTTEADLPEDRIPGVKQRNDQRRIGRLESLVETYDLEDRCNRDEDDGYYRCKVGKLRGWLDRRLSHGVSRLAGFSGSSRILTLLPALASRQNRDQATHTAFVNTKHPPAKLPPTTAHPIPCIYLTRSSFVRSNILSNLANAAPRTPLHRAQRPLRTLTTRFCDAARDRPPPVAGGSEGSNSPVGESDSRDFKRRARRRVISYLFGESARFESD